ncbi:MAG: PQQ-binding-like beta-propeller repeat protein [Deltaproteobacteria bacterium]|nr:PQQ-binding-like beta-propeller repeat protein [Deltaproteobacteria bacterium]
MREQHQACAFVVAMASLLCGCQASTVRRPYEQTSRNEATGGVLSLLWRSDVHVHALFEPAPEECARGALVGKRLVLGSRNRKVAAFDTDSGQRLWQKNVGAQVESEAAYDPARGLVYLGANDGQLLALDPADGNIRWRYQAEGGIANAPLLVGDNLYFSTNRGRLYAVSASTGKFLWDYERERPDEFTIHGDSSPRLFGDRLYAGFSDGFLTALRPGTGDVEWARSLASGSNQYVDVDTTPVMVDGTLIAGSHSGGIYGLHPTDGLVKWRVPVEGAGSPAQWGTQVYFVAPREGLHALDGRTGHITYRRGLTGAGAVTTPQVVGPYLVFSGSRTGIYVVDRETGRLRQTFFPGRGMCASPTVDEEHRRLYALSNGGTLYAFSMNW